MQKSEPAADLALLKKLEADLREISDTEAIEIDPSALRQFNAGLFSALALHGLPVSNAHRGAAVRALKACIELIRSREEWRKANLAVPLVELQAALADLEYDGHVAPMLRTKPRDTRGGPAISFADSIRRAHAAYIMDGLMKHAGMKKEDAAKWVAAKLVAAGHNVSFHTVIDWRKDANNARKNERTNKSYRFLQEKGRGDWADPMTCAETLTERMIATMPKGE